MALASSMPSPQPPSKLSICCSRVVRRVVNLYLRGVDKTLRRLGYRISPSAQGYFIAEEVISAATKHRLPVPEYLETVDLGGVGKRRDFIIDQLLARHSIDYGGSLLEIGSGTCMFLEKIAEATRPSRVEIYEPDRGWRRYAKAHLGELFLELSAWNANGRSLDCTRSESIDTVYAHGVLVYTPLLVSWGYMEEAGRVLKPGGLFVFDVFLVDNSLQSVIMAFRASNPAGSDFPVFLQRSWIDDAAQTLGFKIEASFKTPYHGIESTYIILRKQTADH